MRGYPELPGNLSIKEKKAQLWSAKEVEQEGKHKL